MLGLLTRNRRSGARLRNFYRVTMHALQMKTGHTILVFDTANGHRKVTRTAQGLLWQPVTAREVPDMRTHAAWVSESVHIHPELAKRLGLS